MAGRFSIDAVFRAVDRISRPVAKMQSRVNRFARNAERGLTNVNRVTGRIAGGIKTAGLAAAGAAAAVGVVGAKVVSTGSDFEQQIANLGAVSFKTRSQIADLEKKARELGETTKFSAVEAAAGMEILAKAGFTNEEILVGVEGVLDAAAASGMELAEVSGHVSNVLKGMGLEASEATRVADVLALASSRTNSSIATLGESMANVSSTARQFKIPLEDAVAGVALLQDVGLDASVAGSAMNTMLTKLAKPTAEISRKMKKMGVTFQDAEGNMLPFPEVMANLSKAAQKAGGNMDTAAFFADLVGLRGQKAAVNLQDLFQAGKVEELTKELNNAEGAAKKMAALRMDTFRGDLLVLDAAVEGVKTEIFDLNSGPLRGVVQGMTAWVTANKGIIKSKIQDFLAAITNNLDSIIVALKVIGVSLAVFYTFAAAVKVATAAVAIYNGVVKAWTVATKIASAAQAAFNLIMAANPIVLIGLAIAGVVALVIAFWPEISEVVLAVWETIKSATGAVADFFVDVWEKSVALFKSVWTGIRDFFVGLWTKIKIVFRVFWGLMMKDIQAKVALFKEIWGKVKGFFSSLWKGIKAIALGVFDSIMSKIRAVIDFAKKGVDAVKNFLGFGDDEDEGTAASGARGSRASTPQVVTPQERTAREVSETTSITRGEVTIRDETGRATVTRNPKDRAVGLRMRQTGAF